MAQTTLGLYKIRKQYYHNVYITLAREKIHYMIHGTEKIHNAHSSY